MASPLPFLLLHGAFGASLTLPLKPLFRKPHFNSTSTWNERRHRACLQNCSDYNFLMLASLSLSPTTIINAIHPFASLRSEKEGSNWNLVKQFHKWNGKNIGIYLPAPPLHNHRLFMFHKNVVNLHANISTTCEVRSHNDNWIFNW